MRPDSSKPPSSDISIEPFARVRFVPTPLAGFTDLMGFHRHLLADERRTAAFVAAVERAVRPGDVVADLGTGSGVLALAAARAGAARVYALDFSPIVRLLPELARANGLAGRVIPIERDSREVALPEPVDVLVSECLGFFGVGGTMLPAVGDLARRALRPGGRVVPARVVARAAPVECAAARSTVRIFDTLRPGGFDFSCASRLAVHNLYVGSFAAGELLAPARSLIEVEPRACAGGPLAGAAEFSLARDATLDGFCGFFDAVLDEQATLGSGPQDPPTVWEQTFLPLDEPWPVREGDALRLELEVRTESRELPVEIEWRAELRGAAACVRRSTQSTPRSIP